MAQDSHGTPAAHSSAADPDGYGAAEETSPIQYEGYAVDEVMAHLRWFQHIVADGESRMNVKEMIGIVEDMSRGLHIPAKDPFHKAAAVAFELVVQNHLNPWEIDLQKFTALFRERYKDEDDIDFITTGKLYVLAWEILRRQSEQILHSAEDRFRPKPEESQAAEGIPEWMSDDQDFQFTSAVLEGAGPEMVPAVFHPGVRKVSLVDLLKAFKDASKDAETLQVLRVEQEKERLRMSGVRETAVRGMLHKEDIQEACRSLWELLQKQGTAVVTLHQLARSDAWEPQVEALMASLFLARQGRIFLWQDRFPTGTISVQRLIEGEKPPEFPPEAPPTDLPDRPPPPWLRERKPRAPGFRKKKTEEQMPAGSDAPTGVAMDPPTGAKAGEPSTAVAPESTPARKGRGRGKATAEPPAKKPAIP